MRSGNGVYINNSNSVRQIQQSIEDAKTASVFGGGTRAGSIL